ncbi:MAG: hypothetical protein K9N35_01190 [Candidatus Marinimicrobia bacterium]|nr:hypothetical protein [Candidatus Neomarinimicrobiota bacterium]
MLEKLLFERDRVQKSYVRWKYGHSDEMFRGVLAEIDSKAVACFGMIQKELLMTDGSLLKCGWFADWYVVPEARGHKVGEIMLNALSEHEQIVFGHPGPQQAQELCLKNDYHPIGFHSRRRFVLRPWSYNWKRRSLLSSISGGIKSRVQKIDSHRPIDTVGANEILDDGSKQSGKEEILSFRVSRDMEEMIKHQPITRHFKRNYDEWHGKSVCIKYFDETLENGERRRSVLFFSGSDLVDRELWMAFIQDTRLLKLDYIELFTSNQKLDALFQQLGAWLIYEPPILVKGLDQRIRVNIQAWDRENWTYLAGNQEA